MLGRLMSEGIRGVKTGHASGVQSSVNGSVQHIGYQGANNRTR